jgi:Septum formation
VNERWVCKRCFADNDGSVSTCQRCGLIRGAEATETDQTAWAAAPQAEAQADGGGLMRQVLRFWWIPAAAIALAIGYFTTAQRSDDGSLSSAGTVTVEDLRVGDCFNAGEFSEGEDAEVSDVDGVPCDAPHAFEVFAVADYDGSTYPATQAQFEAAFDAVCVGPFEDYVGMAYADSVLWASAITPTEDGWNSGDREFICHLHNEDASPITGSQRGANR